MRSIAPPFFATRGTAMDKPLPCAVSCAYSGPLKSLKVLAFDEGFIAR